MCLDLPYEYSTSYCNWRCAQERICECRLINLFHAFSAAQVIATFISQFTIVRQEQRFVATHKSKHIAKHYFIMLARYLHLALLAATAATAFYQNTPESADNNSNDMARQLAGDFNWDIQLEDGYDPNKESEEHSPTESSWTSSSTGTTAS
jgi:hypothetical protein